MEVMLTVILLQREPEPRPSYVLSGADYRAIGSQNLGLLQTSGWMKNKVTQPLAFTYG